jgi:hypothetical protein
MHIPKTETQHLRIMSFEEAKSESISETYDRDKWLYIPDFYTEYRYVLGTRGERPVICVGINPSTAEPDNLDPTLKSVARISAANGYDSWLMFNVYAQRATRPDDMDPVRNELLHGENLLAFRALLTDAAAGGNAPVIWAAWGAVIEKRPWLRDCVTDMEKIAEQYSAVWVCAGRCSVKGHPHHPLYLKKDEIFRPFDIRRYLA